MNNRNRLINDLLILVLISFSTTGYSLSTDKDQPIEVEADYAELDDEKGITVYKGNVIVTQGSMEIKGDILTVTYTEDQDLDTMTVEGKPAHYQQRPDNSEVLDEAEALRMEYHSTKSLIVLIDNALVKQEELRFTGNVIEYDTERSKVKARSKKAPAKTSGADGKAEDRDSRVKLILKPKKKK